MKLYLKDEFYSTKNVKKNKKLALFKNISKIIY